MACYISLKNLKDKNSKMLKNSKILALGWKLWPSKGIASPRELIWGKIKIVGSHNLANKCRIWENKYNTLIHHKNKSQKGVCIWD